TQPELGSCPTRRSSDLAARSGRQNIAEGSRAGGASSKSELFLTNVARASLEELLLDYEDYLRHSDLPLWQKESPEALEVRALMRSEEHTSELQSRENLV